MQLSVVLLQTFALISGTTESQAHILNLLNNSDMKAFRMYSNSHTPDMSSDYQTQKALNKPSDANAHIVNLFSRPSLCQLPV